MALWLLSAYATNSDEKSSENLRTCVRQEVAPTSEEATALLATMVQERQMALSEVTVVAQAQIGITGSHPALSGRLAVHLAELAPVQIADGDVAALGGIDLLFVAKGDRSFIAAAAAAGVQHVVLLSSADADAGAVSTRGSDAFDAEQALRESGMGFTILRLNITADEALSLVGGEGTIAVVSLFDVARISTFVLNRPADHLGQTYTLTGEESLTLAEIASRLVPVPDRAPIPVADDLYAAIAAGAFSEPTVDVEIIGRWTPHGLDRAFDVF